MARAHINLKFIRLKRLKYGKFAIAHDECTRKKSNAVLLLTIRESSFPIRIFEDEICQCKNSGK